MSNEKKEIVSYIRNKLQVTVFALESLQKEKEYQKINFERNGGFTRSNQTIRRFAGT